MIIISHTGFLLPNDLRAYWATQVLLGITGNQPLVGGPSATVIQGGPIFGNATLTHLYAAHVLLLPGAAIVMLAAHLSLKNRHGPSLPPELAANDVTLRRETWVQAQAFKDVMLSVVVLAGVGLYTWFTHGPELSAPGDPAIEYVARPEWYFLPIFKLRHWFTGSSEFIATSVLPGIGLGMLAGLPFIYTRLKARTAKAHQLLVAGVLERPRRHGDSRRHDGVRKMRPTRRLRRSTRRPRRSRTRKHRLSRAIGVPVSGPLELYKNDPVVWGARVFIRECAACHEDCSNKPFKGVMCLQGYGSREWVKTFLKDPRDLHFFGNTKIDEMDSFTGDEPTANALAEFVYAQSNRPDANAELAGQGRAAFEKEGCESCHTLDDEGTGDAPALKGWATEAWLHSFIRTPEAERFYGKENEMDSFPHEKLDKDDLTAVISYLRDQSKGRLNFDRRDP